MLLFDLNSNEVEISRHYNILKTKAKLLVFVLFTLAQNSDGPQTFNSVYLFMYTNSIQTFKLIDQIFL